MSLFEKQRTDWQFAEPRLTSGAFDLLDKHRSPHISEELSNRETWVYSPLFCSD
jgi:hypothetical protein